MGSIPVARVNLALPVDTMILIERECDKRGINRVQFIKEAIHEKLKTIINGFTIYTHKKVAGDLGGFEVEGGTEEGEVTFF